jgi:hypothetical protein
MPNIGDFTTGLQRSIVVIDNVTQLSVDFGGDILDLTADEVTKEIQIDPISTQGYSKYKTTWDGWKGSISVARNNGNGDLFEAAQELLYHTGGSQHQFTIEETTYNTDGSVTTMQYTGATFTMPSAGNAKKDAAIEYKFEVRAQARQPLA